MNIPLEDDVAMNAEANSPLADVSPGQPENGIVDFNRTTYYHAQRLFAEGATAEDIARVTGVCLSRCQRFVEEEPARREKAEAALEKAVNPPADDDGDED